MWLWFYQTKKEEKAVNVSIFTVRHVFVEFVEGMKSGIRNPPISFLMVRPLAQWYTYQKARRFLPKREPVIN